MEQSAKLPILRREGRIRGLLSNQAFSLFLILILMWLVLGLLSPYFFTVNNVLQITLQAAVMALIAAGETFVIISGGIDLSVGSIFAFSAMVAGVATRDGLGLGGAIIFGLGAGALLGLINGIGVARLGLPAFIVTLGMMSVARGLALLLNNGVPIFGLIEGFKILGQERIGGIVPVPTIIVLIVYIGCWFILRYTPFGRFTYAIGSNSEAARLSGVRISRNLIGIYVLCGALTALASLIESSRLNSFQPASGVGYELDAIGAVVIGGTSLFGGEGSILASLVGALIIATIRNGLNILGISAFWQNVATGAIIVLAVYLDRLRRNRQGV
ncbi:MAG: ABC transporter permease [Chloroflexi bacterium]|nr:ABC transporter permease [Chloroflexota bacterium]MDL1884087.1 ABC transporter permease [Anaerolineae bacterium CFX8]GIL12416.1 MAG: ribose ABC transporter permease [Chloroflexota bacterium]